MNIERETPPKKKLAHKWKRNFPKLKHCGLTLEI